MKAAFFSAVATALQAMRNCEKCRDSDTAAPPAIAHFGGMVREWADYLNDIVRKHAPDGSGFDHGTTLDMDRSTPDRLVFVTAFHHMNDGGFYDGWTDHTVTVTPSFIGGYDIRISGRDRNGIKDFIAEAFASLAQCNPETLAEWRARNASKAA